MGEKVEIDIIAKVQESINGLQKLVTSFAAAYLSVEAFKRLVIGSIDEYLKAEESQARLAAAIKITGQEGKASLDGLVAFAHALSYTTNFTHEETEAAAGLLMQLGNLSEHGVKKAIPILQDFARFMGWDLNSAAQKFSQTLVGTRNTLGRYIGEIDKSLPPQEKFNEILGKLDSKVHGFAETLATTTEGGKIKQFKIQIDELKEGFGRLAVAVSSPTIEKALTFFSFERATNRSIYDISNIKEAEGYLATIREELIGQKKAAAAVTPGFLTSNKQIETRNKLIKDYEYRITELTGRINQLKLIESQENKTTSDFNKSTELSIAQFEDLGKGAQAALAYYNAMGNGANELARKQNKLKAALADTTQELQYMRDAFDAAINREILADLDKMEASIKGAAGPGMESLKDMLQQFADAAVDFGTAIGQGDTAGAFKQVIEQASRALTAWAIAAAAECFAMGNPAMGAFWLGMAGIGIAGQIGANLFGGGGNANIPHYGSGGIVTRPTLAIVGEVPERISPLNGPGGGNTYNYNIHGNVWSEDDLARAISRKMASW